MATSSRTRRRAPAIAIAALLLLPAPALAGSARVDRAANGFPTVVFQGGAEANTVGVSRDVPSAKNEIDYFFSDSHAITPGAGCAHNGATTQVKCIIPGRAESFGHILLGGGNDNTNIGFTTIGLDGEAGDDTVGGHSGIKGGPGNDTVNGTFSSDSFIVAAGDGTDTFNGGGSIDVLVLEHPGTLDLRGTPDTFNSVEMLHGTEGDDTIIADDHIVDTTSGAGWMIFGSNGDDHLVAGAAPTTFSGGNGDDHLEGGAGGDSLSAGDGNDFLEGNGGGDTFDAGNDHDTLDGGDGLDNLFGGDGDDTLLSVDGVVDHLTCGDGNDRTIADDDDDVASDCELDGLDVDGDGLKDVWEQDGFDADGDGTPEVDLPAMGARVRHKDVFVELDFMPPHQLDQAAIDKVVAAFKAAPVPNPDGSTGITLHVDNGPTSVMNPVTGTKWATRSRQSSIAHQAQTGSVSAGMYDWGPFDTLKAANFDPDRAPVFHYAISAHAHDGTHTGNSRGVSASDFLVTLGAGCQAVNGSDCTLDTMGQAGTFMHELGHNLGLHHGGADETPNKPNYLSVMNYSYQLTGLVRDDLTATLDYSRFVLSVAETQLDETAGFGVPANGPGVHLLALVYCPNGSQTMQRLLAGDYDFNCDSAIDRSGTVAVDINHDGDTFTLDGFDDWPALSYAGGAIGAQGRPVEAATVSDEVPLAELVDSKRAIEAYIAAHQPSGGGPSGGGPGPTPSTGGPPAAPAQTAPAPVRLTRLKVERAAHRRLKITYRLTRAAKVTLVLQRRVGRRWVTVRRFKQKGKRGANTLRISAKRLHKGRYRLVARPRGGAPARAKFVVRPSST